MKSNRGYKIFVRDQLGLFKATPPDRVSAGNESNMKHADDNPGVKNPRKLRHSKKYKGYKVPGVRTEQAVFYEYTSEFLLHFPA